MISRIAKFLAAALLSCVTGVASANYPAVDIFNAPGVPDTSGSAMAMGPCYCDQTVSFTSVILLQPGTYNLGTVREYWEPSGFTPDGGDDQAYLYLLFAPVVTSGDWPYVFPPWADYLWPAAYDQCLQDDAACNARYDGKYQDFPLIYTVQPYENAIQVGLVGRFEYIAAVPEPLTRVMLVLGSVLIAWLARRGRSPTAVFASTGSTARPSTR